MFWPISRGATTLLFDEPAHANAPPTFGPYRVLHQIGSGVLGPVFRTHDPRQDRLVAIKAFALDLIPEQAESLAETLRTLVRTASEHRSAVSVIDAGLEGHTPYLAMAFETRETLDLGLRRGAAGPAGRIAALVNQLAEVIDRFAQEGCRHGGLHPRDVFVTESGTGVRVTGFGVSQALAIAGVRWPGRRPYASPERADADWDTRADVYALGAIAHELLTGRRPVGSGEQDGEFGSDVALNQRPPLRRLLATALAERPQDRFATAGALAAALADALGQTLDAPVAEPMPAPLPGSPPLLVPAEDFADEFPSEASVVHIDRMEPPDDAADNLVLHPGAVLFADLEMQPASRDADADALDRPRAWDEDAVEGAAPPAPARRWDGIAAVALGGLALGALIVLAAVRGLSPAEPAPADTSAAAAAGTPAPGSDPADATERAAAVNAPPAAAAIEPRTTAAPSSRAPAAPGRLVVESDPEGALVTIDGRHWGGTPVTARNLPLGTHTVQVARPGYVPERTTVTLTSGAPAQALRLSLEPGLPQPGVAPPAGPSGAIDVDSRPRGARVSIDGRFVGTAPLRLADLEPGPHALTFEMSGHTGASRRVQVEPGEVARLVVDLE